ncbi:MAG TPA: DUF6152 family protein [Bryobacteraceae bacterium]|nr:DUF6152 family protein [Bryobacteraceae bacterium]
MKRILLPAAVALLVSLPLLAHHSFAAEYDQKQPLTIKGVVTKLDWMNPHVYFYVDSTDSDGKVTHWACEAGNPNALARRGWKKDSLKAGDRVTIQAFRAKDASNTVNARSIVLTDGKKIFAGSADDGGPAEDAESKRPLN